MSNPSELNHDSDDDYEQHDDQINDSNKKDTLDAWVIFEHLYGAQRQDLREYLVHQLYYLSDDDIDFFLPQLCTLLVVRDESLSKQLECFILRQCLKSIDFAIKCFWNLHAIQFYSESERERACCDDLRQNLEMIVVNGNLPKNLVAQLPPDIKQEMINENKAPSLQQMHAANGNQNEEQKYEQLNGHHHLSPQHNDSSNGNAHNGHSPSPSPNNNGSKPVLSTSLPKPKKPDNLTEEHSLINNAHEYLKKQRRCTYFNAELDFAHFLEGVSSALEQCDNEDRPRLLEENIRYANKCLPRGLYIPIAHSASERHQSLLRIVPSDAKCLDSKQKVPFLLFCEVEQHEYPVSSPQICEELTESDTALLQSSGLYVLIDEHRKKKDREKHKPKEEKTKHKKEKKPHPKRLQPKIRKPSRPRIGFSRSRKKDDDDNSNSHEKHDDDEHNSKLSKSTKKPQSVSPSKSATKSKSNFKIASKMMSLKKSRSTGAPEPADRAKASKPSKASSNGVKSSHNTPSPPGQDEHTLSAEEYSISRPGYSDEEEEETKQSRDSNDNEPSCDSNENEQTANTEPSQSVTNSTQIKPKLMALASMPAPKPRPKDEEADRNMERHLKTILPFEPADKKAIKSPLAKYKHIGNQSQDDLDNSPTLLRPNHKHNPASQSSSVLVSPTLKVRTVRSRTPEPDKQRKFKQNANNTDALYQSKSDGNSENSEMMQSPTSMSVSKTEAESSPILQSNRSPSPQRRGASSPQIVVNNSNNGSTPPSFMAHQSQPLSARQASPNVVIYRHPNYQRQKHNKLQYLRGKSMSWRDPFGEPWDKRMLRYREQSPFKHSERWGMQSVIFKSGEDMRQEQMAMQFIKLFDKIWKEAKLPLQLRPYSVIVTSPASGFVETVPNAVSISRLKHSVSNFVSMRKFFEQFYGPVGSPGFQEAQRNFVESMAGYSLVSYLLQIKDRHNGNILLSSEGRVIHIDFDFLFSNSPGGNIGFESAPFKLTEEFIEVMGGEENSEMFDYFKILLIRGFLEARKHVRKFVLISKIMLEGAPMPCFLAGGTVVAQLEERFATKLKNEKCVEHVYNLIEESACNWRSVQYDKFQRITNNIL
eukprot:CAMPEP_0197024018 /NCGR_PEP_ID=MMETSP1384-20130603/4673_1 /TAXON_ID=29189 /ORGANISM="Ammonia sp." /LENGTH=1099 /DNA_ID=CAMNT_0042452345 /DNA_START=16 /DNA_END=3315 /DNA_ORIENTATION=+